MSSTPTSASSTPTSQRAPAVARGGVEHEHRGEDVVGEVEQEIDRREARQFGVRAQQAERAERIGAASS